MTSAPSPPPDPAEPGSAPPPTGSWRPATILAALVVVLAHAALLVVGTVSSGIMLSLFFLRRSGAGATPEVLVPVLVVNLLSLVQAAVDVVLGLGVWRGSSRFRAALSGWLALAWAITLVGIVAATSRSIPPNAFLVAQAVVCPAAVVLLWWPASSAWLRRSAPPG